MRFREQNVLNFEQNFTEVCSRGFDNYLALVKTMAWRRISATPLSESLLIKFTDAMLIQFTDAYMQHWGGGGNRIKNLIKATIRQKHR